MASIPNQLPPNARLAFKGKIFEVWQWEQTLYDGSIVTYERVRRPPTIIIIAAVGDKIIAQEQRQPTREKSYWSLPGGAAEWDEDPLEAAKRELVEETGYTSDDWALLREQKPFSKLIWSVCTYLARNCREDKLPSPEAGEKIKNHLLTLDQFLLLTDNPQFQDNAIVDHLLRVRYDPRAKEEFRQLVWEKQLT